MAKKSKRPPRRAPIRPRAAQIQKRSALERFPTDVIWVICFTLVASVLRFYQLGEHSLWIDESDSLYLSGTIPSKPFFAEPHYLYWLFVYPFLQIKFSVFWLRFFSALCGVLSVPVAYGLGRLWFDRWTGRFFSAAIALSPYLLFYSREARYYSAMILVSLVSLLLLTLIARKPRWWLVPIFLAVHIVAYGIHPTSLVFFASQVMFLGFYAAWALFRLLDRRSLTPSLIAILKRNWAFLLVTGAMLIFAVFAYQRFSTVRMRSIFDLDPSHRAVNVQFTLSFFVQPFIEFVRMPRMPTPPIAQWFFLTSLAAGVGLSLIRRRRRCWPLLFFVAWTMTFLALWNFPSQNLFRIKYVSYLQPLVLLFAVYAWAGGLDWLRSRFAFARKPVILGSIAVAFLLVAHAPYARPTRDLLREGIVSFRGAVEHIAKVGTPADTVFCDMMGYYGLRTHWPLRGFPPQSLAYFRNLHHNMKPQEAALMGRHALIGPGNKWWLAFEERSVTDEERFFMDWLGEGFQRVETFPPTPYDLWDYRVPLSAWKHQNSTVMPPGPNFIPLLDSSDLARRYDLNVGSWDPATSTWRREIYVALSTRYDFRVRDIRERAVPIEAGTLRSIGGENAQIELEISGAGHLEGVIEDGFYELELRLGPMNDSPPFDPRRAILEVIEIAEGNPYFRPEGFRTRRKDMSFAARDDGSGLLVLLLPFESSIEYPVFINETGRFRLKLLFVRSAQSAMFAEVEALIDQRNLGILHQIVKDAEGVPAPQVRSPAMDLKEGPHRFTFRLRRPAAIPARSQFCIFAGFELEKLPAQS